LAQAYHATWYIHAMSNSSKKKCSGDKKAAKLGFGFISFSNNFFYAYLSRKEKLLVFLLLFFFFIALL